MENKNFFNPLKLLVCFIALIIFIPLCYLISFIVSQIFQYEKYSFLSMVTVVTFAFLSIIFTFYIHNSGHYLVGKMLGYKLLKWKPFDIIMVPYKKHTLLKKQFYYFLGGILFEFIVGVFLVLLIIFLPWKIDDLIRLLALFVAVTCFAHAFAILSTASSIISYFLSLEKKTDGMILSDIIFKKNRARNFLYDHNFKQGLAFGYRPSKLPLAKFNKTFEKSKTITSDNFILVLNSYYKAMDCKDFKSILFYADLFEINFDNIPDDLKTAVNSELCFINCIKQDPQNASRYYNDIKDHLDNSCELAALRIKVYYEYYIKNNNNEALLYANAALRIKDFTELKGMIPIETELINDIISLTSS